MVLLVGDDIEMTCSVADGTEYPVLWMKLGTNGMRYDNDI